ncbi:MAG TPA: 2-isopropylmalate synthase [Gemmatimonadaceae bacterium]|nr:2-isopropylmalate synthase [Gemmatimonadaceae bacterium]
MDSSSTTTTSSDESASLSEGDGLNDHVRIFDTTLRDGEQAPGCTMTRSEKLEIAHQLARLGVDIIEAGFPAASPGDRDAVHAIAEAVGTPDGPVICGLARTSTRDIDMCWDAIEPAAKKRIHTFLATSDIHLEHKLRMSRARALETVGAMVAYARGLCTDVEFSPEDAGRSDPHFLYQVLEIAVDAGATTLNIPDTVGYTTPDEYGALIAGIRRHVRGIEHVTLSTHCHDDLGLAVGNSLAGVRAGARQIECTINGIGERAGNASLEECVMALHTRRHFFGVGTRINTRELTRASRLVSACIGIHVPPNKAIVGANAFAHEAGIHQDGVLKYRLTYEIMSADTVGQDGNALVLGKHSGRHAFRTHLEGMGYHVADDELNRVFARFKEIADKKKIVDDRDIEALLAGEVQRPVAIYELDQVQVSCGTHAIPTATVRMRGPGGAVRTESAQGTGPVDAVCQAVNQIVGEPGELIEFAVNAITEGIDAVGEVTIRVQEYVARSGETDGDAVAGNAGRAHRVFSGYGVHTDIVVAAAEAYVAALNKLFHARESRQREEGAVYAGE